MDIYVIKIRFDIATPPACSTLPYCLSFQGFPGSSDGKESASNAGDQGSIPVMGRSPGEGNGNPTHSSILAWRIPWQRSLAGYSLWDHKESDTTEQLTHTHYQQGFPGGSDRKESVCNARDPGSIPGLGRFPGEGLGCPLQYFCLGNPMVRRVWRATVHGLTTTQTQMNG